VPPTLLLTTYWSGAGNSGAWRARVQAHCVADADHVTRLLRLSPGGSLPCTLCCMPANLRVVESSDCAAPDSSSTFFELQCDQRLEVLGLSGWADVPLALPLLLTLYAPPDVDL
jgi:hypothetical protein